MVLDFTKLTHQSGQIQFSSNAMWCKLLGEQLGNTAYHWLSTMFELNNHLCDEIQFQSCSGTIS